MPLESHSLSEETFSVGSPTHPHTETTEEVSPSLTFGYTRDTNDTTQPVQLFSRLRTGLALLMQVWAQEHLCRFMFTRGRSTRESLQQPTPTTFILLYIMAQITTIF